MFIVLFPTRKNEQSQKLFKFICIEIFWKCMYAVQIRYTLFSFLYVWLYHETISGIAVCPHFKIASCSLVNNRKSKRKILRRLMRKSHFWRKKKTAGYCQDCQRYNVVYAMGISRISSRVFDFKRLKSFGFLHPALHGFMLTLGVLKPLWSYWQCFSNVLLYSIALRIFIDCIPW